MSKRSAREVVELYNVVVWNEPDLSLAKGLLADEVVRHEVGSVTRLTRGEACKRIADHWSAVEHFAFRLPLVIAGDDGEYVAVLFEADVHGPEGAHDELASIEVFRVLDGRICEVWNTTVQHGRWH